MKVLVFGASNHSNSINATLARYTAARLKSEFKPDADIAEIDLNDFEMPIYSIDREMTDGVHQLAKDFYGRIGAADALIISFPEYNGSYTSAWKNIHDWMSRIDMAIYQNKPLIALSATPGPRAGLGVLQAVEDTAPFFGVDLRGRIGVGTWGEAFDYETSSLLRADDITAIDNALGKLING